MLLKASCFSGFLHVCDYPTRIRKGKKAPLSSRLAGQKAARRDVNPEPKNPCVLNLPRIPMWNPMLLLILKAYHSKYCECKLISKEGKQFCRVEMYRWGEMNRRETGIKN